MRLLSVIDQTILHHLAHYKFLTLSQLVRLRTGEKSYLSSRLKLLRDDGFVGTSQYGGIYKKGEGGRVENIHYLMPKGAKLLAENSELTLEMIHYPKNIDGIFRNDYFHRISTVNTWIAFEQWLREQSYQPLFVHTYFHKIGSSRKREEHDILRSITRVTFNDGSFVEPDVALAYHTGEKKQLLIIEVSNGRDTTRIVDQLKRLSVAVSQGLITRLYQNEYDIHVSPRILSTLETSDMLRLVLKRIHSDSFFTLPWMKQAFFFQTADKVKEDFAKEWFTLSGEVTTLPTM